MFLASRVQCSGKMPKLHIKEDIIDSSGNIIAHILYFWELVHLIFIIYHFYVTCIQKC